MRTRTAFVVLALAAAACGGGEAVDDDIVATTATIPLGPGTTAPPGTGVTSTTQPSSPLLGLSATTVARTLDTPVFLTAPLGDDRLFVLEKPGTVRIIDEGVLLDEPFLDLTADVESAGLEQGLLGLAFHPDYPANGRFFVYFTGDQGASRLYEYRVSDDPMRADPASGILMLHQPQPATNHNAGMLQFGPDGYLYVGLGDGGGANDQFGNGQRTDTLLGTILRIDVDSAEPYAIPPDNPFVETGGAPQVWAYGLRNPWRFDIDPVDGLIYIGDVGQDRWEEVSVANISDSGINFGWPITEGDECFATEECESAGQSLPALAYDHAEGCSIIGGFVYRGSAMPELHGHYFYGDWCAGWVRSFRLAAGGVSDEQDWTADLGSMGQLLSFGRGGDGEIYALTQDGLVIEIGPRR